MVMRRSREKYEVDGRRVVDGKPVGTREYFDLKDAAEKRASELRGDVSKKGTETLTLTTGDRVMAESCIRCLAAKGKTLNDATEHYLEYLASIEKSITWKPFVDDLVKYKKAMGMSERHQGDLTSRLGQFAECAGERTLAEITTADVDRWLNSLKVRKNLPHAGKVGTDVSATSRNNSRRLLKLAFNRAVALGYCKTNPVNKTEEAFEPRREDSGSGRDGEVTTADILLPCEMSALFRVAEQSLIPCLALAAFAGIRREELKRLKWGRINLDTKKIFIPENVAKVRKKKAKDPNSRYIPISPNLAAWLRPFSDKQSKEPVAAKNFREQLDRARKKARELLISENAERKLERWPQNCLRHSFCSYHLAKHKNPKNLAMIMGHTTPDLVKNTYASVVSEKRAADWWKITPSQVSPSPLSDHPKHTAAPSEKSSARRSSPSR